MTTSPSSYRNTVDLFTRSRQYFITAVMVFEHPCVIPSQVRVPLLLLIAQGIEVFLKAVLLTKNHELEKLKKTPFGHDIFYMWNLDEMEMLRREVLSYAGNAEERAFTTVSMSGPKSQDPAEDMVLHLERLSTLHTSPSGYALRYLPDGVGTAPPPHLMLYCFDQLIERILGAPDHMGHLIGQAGIEAFRSTRSI